MEPPLGFDKFLWDLWCNGAVHTVTESDRSMSFVGALRTQARKRKLYLWYEDDRGCITFQFYTTMYQREQERGLVGLQWYD